MAKTRISATFVPFFLSIISIACVSATPTVYRDAKGLPPRSPDDVEVFWVAPSFEYRSIGEVYVRACPACSHSQIEEEIREAVAQIGGDVAIVASETTSTKGAVVIPGPYTATVVPSRHRELTVLAALRPTDRGNKALPSPADGTASVTFQSTPTGAEVYVDGSFIGNTPVAGFPLAAGQHRIEFRAQGFVNWERSLVVAAGTPVTVKADLSGQ